MSVTQPPKTGTSSSRDRALQGLAAPRELKLGMSGPDVAALNEMLASIHARIGASALLSASHGDVFTKETETALAYYQTHVLSQSSYGLKGSQAGVFGKAERDNLGDAMKFLPPSYIFGDMNAEKIHLLTAPIPAKAVAAHQVVEPELPIIRPVPRDIPITQTTLPAAAKPREIAPPVVKAEARPVPSAVKVVAPTELAGGPVAAKITSKPVPEKAKPVEVAAVAPQPAKPLPVSPAVKPVPVADTALKPLPVAEKKQPPNDGQPVAVAALAKEAPVPPTTEKVALAASNETPEAKPLFDLPPFAGINYVGLGQATGMRIELAAPPAAKPPAPTPTDQMINALPKPVKDALGTTVRSIDQFADKTGLSELADKTSNAFDKYIGHPVQAMFKGKGVSVSPFSGVPMVSSYRASRATAADADIRQELDAMPTNSNKERQLMPKRVLVNANSLKMLDGTSANAGEDLVRMALGVELDKVSPEAKQAYHQAITEGLKESPVREGDILRVGRGVSSDHDGGDYGRNILGYTHGRKPKVIFDKAPELYATLPGVVTYVGGAQGYGFAVEITSYDPITNMTCVTRCGHLDQLNDRFVAACRCAAEQGVALYVDSSVPIGKMGDAGRSSAPHLHYEVHQYAGPPSALDKKPLEVQIATINGPRSIRSPNSFLKENIYSPDAGGDRRLRGTARDAYNDGYEFVTVLGGQVASQGRGDFASAFRMATGSDPLTVMAAAEKRPAVSPGPRSYEEAWGPIAQLNLKPQQVADNHAPAAPSQPVGTSKAGPTTALTP